MKFFDRSELRTSLLPGCLAALASSPVSVWGQEQRESTACGASQTPEQPPILAEPFVSRVELRGDLVTILEDRGQRYLVPTFRGVKAIADFSRVIELNERASFAYNNRGYYLQLVGKEREAFLDFEKSILLESSYALAHQNLAWLLATSTDLTLRNPTRAIESAKKACVLNQHNDLSDLAALAAAHASAKQFDLALGIQEKIVERAPEEQKGLAKKLLELYRENKPFDPQVATETATEKLLLETPSKE